MVREIKQKPIIFGDNPISYYEYAGLHADTKPTSGVATGSLFLEVDTGDEAGQAWGKIAELGGSGS